MELLVGQTHRNMFGFLSARTCLFLEYRHPLRKLCAPRIARIHSTIWCQNQVDHKHGPLTLSSLGFRSKTKVPKSENIKELGNLNSPMRAPSSKVTSGLKNSKSRVVGNKSVLEIKELGDLNSPMRAPSSKVTSGLKNSKSREVGKKSTLEIEDAPFSAKSFSELGLSPLVITQLEKAGLTAPTDVQSTAIPTIFKNHDVVIQSFTGSGKTLAYLLPILSEVGPLKRSTEGEKTERKPGIEAVIIAPSRELGMQIVREVEKLLGPAEKKFVQQLVGGANRSRQEEALKKNKPAIVVGTPGRIAEISASGKLHTHGCQFLVLDEVDQLLAFNFREDMHRILEHVGKRSGTVSGSSDALLARRSERQIIMVSATVPFSVIRAAGSWGREPFLVRAKNVSPIELASVPGIKASDSGASSTSATQGAVDSLPPALKHYYCVAKMQHKVDTLRRCVHALDSRSVIAFMNHTRQLKDVVFKLEARGIKAAELHGDLGKLGRSTTLKKFKDGNLRVLVTNELSARGLDVSECDLVANLDLPTDSIHYAHRAGRTGRLGRKGYVVTICEESEVFVVKKLQRQLGVSILACEFVEGKLVIGKVEEPREKTTEAGR